MPDRQKKDSLLLKRRMNVICNCDVAPKLLLVCFLPAVLLLGCMGHTMGATLAAANPVQEQIDDGAESSVELVTKAQVDAVRARAAKAQMDEARQQSVSASLAVAESNLARTESAAEKTREKKELAESAQTRTETLKREIAKLGEAVSDVLQVEADELAEAVKTSKANSLVAQTKLRELQPLQADRNEQIAKFPQSLASLAQQKSDLESKLKIPAAVDENPILLEASKLELQSGLQWVAAESAHVQSQNELFEAEQKSSFIATSIELWTVKGKRSQKRADSLEAELAKQRKQDTQKAVVDAKAEVKKAPEILRPFAEKNARIAEAATAILEPARKARKELSAATLRLTQIQDQYKATVNRVDAVGETASVGAYLRNRKKDIPKEGWLSNVAVERIAEIEHCQSDKFDLEEQKQTLIPDNVADEILVQAKLENPHLQDSELTAIRDATLALASHRKELLSQAITNHDDYLESLTELRQTEKALAESTRLFNEYINERILWIRSNNVLFAKSVKDPSAGGWFTFGNDKSDALVFSVSEWLETATALSNQLRRNYFLVALASFVFIGLYVYRFRMRQSIKHDASLVSRGSNTDFVPTLRTLLLTIGITAPFPLLLYFLGWRLGQAADASALTMATSEALIHTGWFFFAGEFLRQICRQDGLAEKHFGWNSRTVSQLKKELGWFVPLGAVFSFGCSILCFIDIDHESDTVERIVFISAIASLTWFISKTLNPQTGMFREQIAQNPKSWYAQFRSIWYWGIVLIPVILIVMVVVGYYYSAIQMLSRFFATIIMVVGFEICRSLLVRFILLSRRKARIAQSRARLLAQHTADGNAQAAALQRATDQEAFLADAIATIDDNVQRSQNLIFAAVAIAWIISSSVIWADVFPAIRGLDKYALWTTTVETVVPAASFSTPLMPLMPLATKADAKAEAGGGKNAAESKSSTTTSAEGEQIVRETKIVSLRHLLMAVFILSIAIFAVRNVPAFLELVLLKHLPVEQSIRHAVKAIAGYIILLIGVVAAGRTMYIGWSQIQWLATALTFGLAFGLQEIFANFMAGIILLLERPIRIGDVISVDDVTGTVSKIRIRATTITDFDRKEYVVPNKEFITGRVLNWTLTDKINRLKVTVGVAYGSDVRRAKEIIMDICQNNPAVVDSPPTTVTFEAFGDSSLNISARTYLKDFDSRWPALDSINLAIDDAFKSEGIEISFPQRDLHIRTASPAFEASVRNSMSSRANDGSQSGVSETDVD